MKFRRKVLWLAVPATLLLLLLVFVFQHHHQQQQKVLFWPSLWRPGQTSTDAALWTAERRLQMDRESGEMQRLVHTCHHGNGSLITAHWQVPGGERARQHFLDTCWPIEISTSQAGRSMGHCSDFVPYVYYAGARLSDEWDADTLRRHVARCPRSIRLHGEFPIRVLFDNQTRNYWMPNAEQVKESDADLIRRSHTLIAKTRHTQQALEAYLAAHSNPVQDPAHEPRIWMPGHTSMDARLGLETSLEPDWEAFLHLYGHSGMKGTDAVIQCWRQHPDWPTLTLVGVESVVAPHRPLPWNVVHLGQLPDEHTVRILQRRHGIHLCPSSSEGFGHYLNEARSIGALILTTDHGPMNEFVTDGVSGLLVRPGDAFQVDGLLLGNYLPTRVRVEADQVCTAVERARSLSIAARQRMGQQARIGFEVERWRMRQELGLLRQEAVAYLRQDSQVMTDHEIATFFDELTDQLRQSSKDA